MFSGVCVKNSFHRGRGVHPPDRHPPGQTSLAGRHPPPADTTSWADTRPPWAATPLPRLRWLLERTVRILLECILVCCDRLGQAKRAMLGYNLPSE